MKQLLEWAKLDERSVQSDLMDQLDSAPADLAELGGMCCAFRQTAVCFAWDVTCDSYKRLLCCRLEAGE